MAVIYYVWRAQELNDVMRINLGINLTREDKSGHSLVIYIARKSKGHVSHHQVLAVRPGKEERKGIIHTATASK